MSSASFGRPDLGWDPERMAGLRDEDFQAPDLIGTVEGWRAWNVLREPPAFGTTPKLESATFKYWWTPRVKARATCERSPEHVPGETCTCGFYAAKTLPHLRAMGYQAYDEEAKRICVVGRLAMWGKVIEGDQGWRAEYAYPHTIYVPFEGWRLARPIQRAYGVPVRLLNLLDSTKLPEDAKDIGG
jgi:hypothetical protein